MKKVQGVYSSPAQHWVGDGFPVRSLFSHASHGEHVSPFLLLDYAGPTDFEPSNQSRGVDTHPHRGFETVTIVYSGEVEHRDSTGQGGVIGAGDVQWMTAASGILHQEFHSEAFTRSGGRLEMVQLWVNLPAKDKNAKPGYQALASQDIPVITLPDNGGALRVIAGDYQGHRGPAKTFTPMDVWDVELKRSRPVTLPLPEGHTAIVMVRKGALRVDGDVVREAEFALFTRTGDAVALEASADASFLVLSGAPIDEPVAMHGPFVMNTEEEIRQAIRDFRNGQFGAIPA